MAQRTYIKELKAAKTPRKILETLEEKEKSYPTEIADEIDSTTTTVMNYLRGLRKANLVERTQKDGRKQYYVLNVLGDDFLRLLREKDEIDRKLEQIIYSPEEVEAE